MDIRKVTPGQIGITDYDNYHSLNCGQDPPFPDDIPAHVQARFAFFKRQNRPYTFEQFTKDLAIERGRAL